MDNNINICFLNYIRLVCKLCFDVDILSKNIK